MTTRKVTLRAGLVAAMMGATVFTSAPAIADPATDVPSSEADVDNNHDNTSHDKVDNDPTAPQPGDVLDLEPEIRVAAGKVPGFAGLVAIHAKNVGNATYFQDYPLTTFRIEVKTDKGPKGVDRLITPGSFSGAYARDLGFNRATSTRTFEVTLSNPIREGKKALIANLNFGDGLTDRGRVTNYITVTQVGRHKNDHSQANDQNIDSRKVTLTDGGRPNAGLF